MQQGSNKHFAQTQQKENECTRYLREYDARVRKLDWVWNASALR